jgi:hypothetical protein
MALQFNADITNLIEKIDLANKVAIEQAYVFIDQITEIGADAARQALNDATTPYGEKRFAKGQGFSAGRNDSGTMISELKALGSDVDSNERVYGQVGWENPEDYFYAQELGGGGGYGPIPAADSLAAAEVAMLNNVGRLEKNMKQRVRYRMK